MDNILVSYIYPGPSGELLVLDEGKLSELRREVVEGRVVGTLVRLALPIVAARLLSSIQESVDAAFLGRVGTQDLAAPAAVWPLIWFFMGINFAVTTTTVAVVSQYIGARKYGEAGEAASRLFGLSILLGLASMAAVVLSAPLVFRLQSIPPGVYDLSLAYLYIESVGIPLTFTLFFFIMLSSSTGDTRTPFKLSALASILNLVLDPVLIFGLGPIPGMGVVGAGLATTISRVIAGGLALHLLLTGYLGYRVTPGKPNTDTLRTVLRIGGPVAVQQILVSSGFLAMMSIVARLGDVVMASYNLGLAIIQLIQTAIWGFNAATATMIGQALGAGLPGRARQVARASAAIVGGSLAVGALILYTQAHWAVAVFTSLEEVARESIVMIRILSPAVPFLGVFFIAQGVARGSGHTGFMSMLGIARLWLLRIPLAYHLALAAGLGSIGVWISMAASNAIAGLIALAWILAGSWTKPVIKKEGMAASPTYS